MKNHPIWLDDISILLKDITDFWPDPKKHINQQINATVRYIMYCSIIVSYLRKSPMFLVVGALLSVLITAIMSNCKGFDRTEILMFIAGKSKPKPKPKDTCKKPTVNNPVMNSIPYEEPLPKCEKVEEEDVIQAFDPITDPNDPFNRRNNSYHSFYNVPDQSFSNFGSFLSQDADLKTNTYYSKGIGSFIN